MSKGMLIKRANKRPKLQYVKNDMMIVLLNSWAMFGNMISTRCKHLVLQGYDAPEIPSAHQALLEEMCTDYENKMRIAICIKKHKPKSEWTPKPRRPDKPYKYFFEFVSDMKDACLERHVLYTFARKLNPGDKISMYDGAYIVKKVHEYKDQADVKGGYVILHKCDKMDDPLYEFTIRWTNKCPKFYEIKKNYDTTEGFDRKNVFVIDFEVGDRVIMKRDDSMISGSVVNVLQDEIYGVLIDGEKYPIIIHKSELAYEPKEENDE